MTTYKLTAGKNTVKGSAHDDTIIAAIDRSQAGAYRSTLNAGDKIGGGDGTDTFVVDMQTQEYFDPATNSYKYQLLNYAFDATFTSIERLVLLGSIDTFELDETPKPIDLAKFSGLQEVRIQASETYGFPDTGGGTTLALRNVSGQHIVLDGTHERSGFAPELDLSYKSTAKTANLTLESGPLALVSMTGAGLTTANLDVTGSGLALLGFSKPAGNGLSKLSTLNVDVEKSAKLLYLAGFVTTLNKILNGASGEDEEDAEDAPQFGLSHLKTVAVTGSGSTLIDLTDNKENVTFKGGKGNDAVLVSPGNLNAKDHFDGGEGKADVFGLSLADAPDKQKTLALSAADYETVNKVAKNFEVVGVLGDFRRTVTVDASRITAAKTVMIGQDAAISKVSDANTVDFQTIGIPAFQESELRLVHAKTSAGQFTGTGAINLAGGDFLHGGDFLNALSGSSGPLAGTAILDASSAYATLNASGTFDLVVESAAVWKDAKGRTHGVAIDASKMTGDAELHGTASSDMLTGGTGDDILEGRGGTDKLSGGKGSDVASFDYAKAGVTVDLMKTAAQSVAGAKVTLSGIEGLRGSAHNDHLYGTDGADTLEGGAGDDRLDGRDGKDTAVYAHAGAGVAVNLSKQGSAQDTKGAGHDTLVSIENLVGSSHDDTLTGNSGDNTLDGGDGHDHLAGGKGDDTFYVHSFDENDTTQLYDGGADDDTFSFARLSGSGFDFGASANFGQSCFVSIENFVGSKLRDDLTGSERGEHISGGDGDDTIIGGGGADVLDGGKGDDRLFDSQSAVTFTGGSGRDIFEFQGFAGSGNVEKITDFNVDDDRIVLQVYFDGSNADLKSGILAEDQFVIGAKAADANDYFIYDSSNGRLYYDADGSGAGEMQQLAQLSAHLKLSAGLISFGED